MSCGRGYPMDSSSYNILYGFKVCIVWGLATLRQNTHSKFMNTMFTPLIEAYMTRIVDESNEKAQRRYEITMRNIESENERRKSNARRTPAWPQRKREKVLTPMPPNSVNFSCRKWRGKDRWILFFRPQPLPTTQLPPNAKGKAPARRKRLVIILFTPLSTNVSVWRNPWT